MKAASSPKQQSVDAMKTNRNLMNRRRFPIRGQRRLRFRKRKTTFQQRKPQRHKHESTTHFQ